MVKPKVGEPKVLFNTMASLKTTLAKITSPALSKLLTAPEALVSPT